MGRAHRTGPLHHAPEKGKLLFRAPDFQLFLGQEGPYFNQIFRDFLIQSGLEFIDLEALRTDRFNFDRRVGQGLPEFQTL